MTTSIIHGAGVPSHQRFSSFTSFTTFGNPSRLLVFFMAATRWFPGLITWVYDHSNHSGMQKLRRNKDEASNVARKLLDLKRQELKDGTSRRDTMSLLGLLLPCL